MITLKQFEGAIVTPADDAALYAHFDNRSGILSGMEIAHLGANQISVGGGRGMICGRTFVVESETILATLATSGTQSGRLLVQINLGNPDAPISFMTQAASVLPDLVQEDLNAGGTVYQLVLATYSVSTTAVSNLVTTSALAPVMSMTAQVVDVPTDAQENYKVNTLNAYSRGGVLDLYLYIEVITPNSSWINVATLPEGFRPPQYLYRDIAHHRPNDNDTLRLRILPTGQVQLTRGTATSGYTFHDVFVQA